MKHTLIILSAMLLGMVATAQKPLLDSTQMPNAVYFLPAPPDTASAAFMYDKAQYRWGKEQRKDSTRLAIAVNDAVWSIDNICHIFSGVLGFDISDQNTPAIYRMLTLGLLTTDQAGKLPKNHYMRTRPYVYYDEPTIYPQDEKWLRTNGSYPSGHTILGYHWQSDVDAARLVASAAVARLHTDKCFMKLMKKARREYKRLSK